MTSRSIRSSPRVRSGRQYRAERSLPAPPLHNVPRPTVEVFRKHPGRGYRHVLHVRHVREFIGILPDWPRLSTGLNAIVLTPPRPNCDGFHRPGLVALCAQPRDLSPLISNPVYVREHRRLFEQLGVPVTRAPGGHVLHYTPATLRAFQLLHVLLHELGHHHDRCTTRSGRRASRGEGYAEQYARDRAAAIWSGYARLAERWGDPVPAASA